MANMDRYAGVQNPQLYQQILEEEERKKRARETQNSAGSEKLRSAARNISSAARAQTASDAWTPEQRQAAFDLMRKTSSTNLFSSLQSIARNEPVQAPKPGIAIDNSNGELDLSTILGGVGYVTADYAKTGAPKQVTLKAPDPKTIKGYRQTWVDEGAGKGYFAETPVYEEDEEDWEDIRQNAPSETELEWYNKAYEDSGMLFEPGMEIGADGTFKEEAPALDPFQKIVIQQRQQHQEEGEKLYDENKEHIRQTTTAANDIYDAYTDSGQGNEVLDYETAVSIFYGRADDSVLEGLSAEQRYAYQSWAQLAQVHDMVDSYIRMYGERGIFTREYLDKLNQQMNGIIKYDRDFWEQMGYQASEILAGVISVGEAALRFTVAASYGLFSAGASLFDSDDRADEWKKRGEGWLSESWSQDFRAHMQAELNADAQDMKIGQYSFMLGQLLPGIVIAASTGGAGTGAMLGASTAGHGSYAVFGALATAGYSAQTAVSEGASFEQALTYGALAGLLDLGATAAFGGVGRKMGIDTQDISQRIAGRVCKSELGEYFAKQFICAAIEQPMDTLAMSIQPALKRMTYDPDAKPYSAKQIAGATMLGFFEKGLRNIAYSLPELGEILGRTRDLGDTSVRVPEHLKAQIDDNFSAAMSKTAAGETPDTGAAEATPDAAVAQMAAEVGNQWFEPQDAGDRLAAVLANDPELAGIEMRTTSNGNGISPIPQGKSSANMEMPASGEQPDFFAQMFAGETGQAVDGQNAAGTADALPSSYTKSGAANDFGFDGGTPANRLAQKTPKDISSSIDDSGSAENLGKILAFEADNDAKVQVGEYGQESSLPIAPKQSSGDTGKPVLENSFVTPDHFEKNRQIFTGKTAEEIALELNNLGYETTVRKSNREGSKAVVIVCTNSSQKEGRNITQVQVSPGGGRHGLPYVKVSTNTDKIIKVIQGSKENYHTDGKEIAHLIFTED